MFILKNKNGFSLIEVLVVAAIIGGLSLVIMKINDNAQKVLTTTELKMSAQREMQIILSDLAKESVCSPTLSGVDISPMALKKYPDGKIPLNYFTKEIEFDFKSLCLSKNNTPGIYKNGQSEKSACNSLFSKTSARFEHFLALCMDKKNNPDMKKCIALAKSEFDPSRSAIKKGTRPYLEVGQSIRGVEFVTAMINQVEAAQASNMRRLHLKIGIDIRGERKKRSLYGDPIMMKEIIVDANIQNLNGKEIITSCRGGASDNAVAQRVCESFGGEYQAGKCKRSALLANCSSRYIMVTSNGGGQRFYTNYLDQTKSDAKVSNIDYLTKSMGTSSSVSKLHYLSAQVCEENESVAFAHGHCQLGGLINPLSSLLPEVYPASISRRGSIHDLSLNSYWTVGCQVPNSHLQGMGSEISANFSVLCCQSRIN